MEGNQDQNGQANKPRAVRARWVWAWPGRPLQDAYVVGNGQRLLAVSQTRPDLPIVERMDVALLPGLINCHTHLEWSHLPQPLGQRQQDFSSWLAHIIAARRFERHWNPQPWRQNRQQGWWQSRQYGVRWIADIVSAECQLEGTCDDPGPWTTAEMTVFAELLGLAPSYWTSQLTVAERVLKQSDGGTFGLSPHAPYTIAEPLLDELIQIARHRSAPMAMHLAESWEELELLDRKTGPLVDLLESLQSWYPKAWGPGTRPWHILQRLAHAPRCLVIHGNYLLRDELGFLAEHRSTMSLVYCPRTHSYFAHRPYPLEEALRLGVRVVLGTDSRATNPDLSLFEEIRFVTQHYPHIDPGTVILMATSWAAESLGIEDQLGAVRDGMSSSVTLIRLADPNCRDFYEALWQGEPLSENPFV